MDLQAILSIKKSSDTKKAACRDCPYHSRTFVPSYIGETDVVIIGEAPGFTEAKELCPFVGESGQLLRKTLREVGFDDTKITYINTVSCHPPSNEKPHKIAQDLCTKLFLFNQLQELKPKLVILAGSVALNTFFPKDSITVKAGSVLSNEQFKFIPVLHPAYCLRNPTSTPKLRKDLKKAYQFVNGSLLINKNYKLVDSLEVLEEARSVILSSPIISYDVETNGTVDVFDPNLELWTVGFGYAPNNAYCFPYEHPEFTNIALKEKCRQTIIEICSSSVRKIAHNAIFDIQVLKKKGIELKGLYADTMVMAALTDENRYSLGLKQLAAEYLDGCVFQWSEKLSELAPYNCEDCDNTLGLFEVFFAQLKPNQRLFGLMKDIIVPMLYVIVDMELDGAYINASTGKKLSDEFHQKLEAIREAIDDRYPEARGVNLSSPKQVGELLFEKLKLPVIRRSEKTKVPSTDDETLSTLAKKKCKLAEFLLQIRKYEKLISTYVEKMPKACGPDGRIHCNFNICGTVTGRISSSKPNLQNIPRDKTVKSMFAAKEGYVLVNADASQAELRVGCSIAQEPRMIEAYQNGADVHRLTASSIWNISLQEVSKDQRQKAKSCNFGFVYGQSPEGFQKLAEHDYGLTLSIEECREFRKKWFDLYPGFPDWYERVRSELREKGYVEYPTGRRRRFPEVKGYTIVPDDIFRRAVNAPVQGSSSDIVLFTMVKLKRIIEKYKLSESMKIIITVHDSIMLECLEKDVSNVLRPEVDLICKHDIPKQFPWLAVPMIFDFGVGPDWGHLMELK